eukprot:TRINITY_DN43614_c0_g1_i1.p1 TRINITY_DN43614_c0_g1~~TRINITY_DN43614_c0_g1_i1.p1  ORF type:complete len:427 (-),score=106.26 TRINITY_DN43614_c0_g1_i1:367-1647(-)
MGNSQKSLTNEELKELWETHDADKSGELDLPEIKKLAEEIRVKEGVAQPLPDAMVESLFKKLDEDESGRINKSEFEGLYALLQQQRKQRAEAAAAAKAAAAAPADGSGGKGAPRAGAASAAVKKAGRSSVQDEPVSDLRSWAQQLRDKDWEHRNKTSGLEVPSTDQRRQVIKGQTALDEVLKLRQSDFSQAPALDAASDQSEADSEDSTDTISGEIARSWDPFTRDARYLYSRDAAVRFTEMWTPMSWSHQEWEHFLSKSGAIFKTQKAPSKFGGIGIGDLDVDDFSPRQADQLMQPKRGVTEHRGAVISRSTGRNPAVSPVQPAVDASSIVCPRTEKVKELDEIRRAGGGGGEADGSTLMSLREMAVKNAVNSFRYQNPRVPQLEPGVYYGTGQDAAPADSGPLPSFGGARAARAPLEKPGRKWL